MWWVGVVKGHLELFRKLICFGGANCPFVKMKNIYNNCNFWYTTSNKIDMLLLFLCSNHTTVRLPLQEEPQKLPQCADIGTSNALQ